MNNYIRFGFTALNGLNKTGVIKPDADGYYQVVLGGLDIYNSAQQFYPFQPAKELFTSSGQLMRRVGDGALRGEYGHPKWIPGMTQDAFAQRILAIYEENVSHHIRQIELNFDDYKDPQGRKVIAIIGWVKPMGPRGEDLKSSLENKNENVCFSIRAFTRDESYGRTTNRILKNVVTWDYVNEPGISIAKKFQSPALEEITEVLFTKKNFDRAFNAPAGMGLESITLNPQELFASFGWDQQTGSGRPAFAQW